MDKSGFCLLTANHYFSQQSVGMISAHVFGDQLIILALDRFVDYVRNNKLITLQAKDQIIYFITIVKSIVPLFQRLNRVLFYWNGSFYSWAKRFFNIRYVRISYKHHNITAIVLNYYFVI